MDEALAFIGEKGKEQALKRFISKTGRGCVGRLTARKRAVVRMLAHSKAPFFK